MRSPTARGFNAKKSFLYVLHGWNFQLGSRIYRVPYGLGQHAEADGKVRRRQRTSNNQRWRNICVASSRTLVTYIYIYTFLGPTVQAKMSLDYTTYAPNAIARTQRTMKCLIGADHSLKNVAETIAKLKSKSRQSSKATWRDCTNVSLYELCQIVM